MFIGKARRLNRIVGSNATYMVCDIQDRFRPLVHQMEAVINRAVLVNKACNILGIPCVITEQYPKAFGKTVPEIEKFPSTKLFEKKQFSMLTDEVAAALKESGRQQVIVSGIESHVCLYQSVLDLVENGFEVFVVADAASSQRAYDRTVALQTLRDTDNVTLTTAESLLFELVRTADHPHFKTISGLLKDHNHLTFVDIP